MTENRGQTSLESLVSIVFAMFILVMVALLAAQKNNEGTDLKIKTDSKRIATSLADNINMIAEQGSGFYKYFSIPEKVYGDNDYNISINSSLLEIDSENYAMVKQLLTANVTRYCLDKGPDKKNKVYNDQEKIYIICNRPELMIMNGTLWPHQAANGTKTNISISIMNFGPVDSETFKVYFNNNNTYSLNTSLKSEEKKEVNVTMDMPPARGPFQVNVTLDPDKKINESIESNNFYNTTINVV